MSVSCQPAYVAAPRARARAWAVAARRWRGLFVRIPTHLQMKSESPSIIGNLRPLQFFPRSTTHTRRAWKLGGKSLQHSGHVSHVSHVSGGQVSQPDPGEPREPREPGVR